VIIVLIVTYERSGCQDIRYFKDKEEFDEWLPRQLEVQPDIKIIETKEEP
jgi:hypothetical protein